MEIIRIQRREILVAIKQMQTRWLYLLAQAWRKILNVNYHIIRAKLFYFNLYL